MEPPTRSKPTTTQHSTQYKEEACRRQQRLDRDFFVRPKCFVWCRHELLGGAAPAPPRGHEDEDEDKEDQTTPHNNKHQHHQP